MNALRRQRGVSLIESMLAIAISGWLLVSGFPLTQGWVASTRVRDTQGLLAQGVSRAKAVALRNPGGVSGNAAAAMLCLDGGRLRLFAATRSPQSAAACASSGALWSATLPASTSVFSGDASLRCLAFSNRAASVAASSGGTACASSTSLLISSANQHASVTLY
ncbi:Tfp pilus assembly protein FimT/FimU [Hydrocarboniphaga effusa]|uniref:pilus assembly FimT family protein n=1 Tax=Hydrocarboniphaga effusa TaxID=243629 RepID=UPI00398C1E25